MKINSEYVVSSDVSFENGNFVETWKENLELFFQILRPTPVRKVWSRTKATDKAKPSSLNPNRKRDSSMKPA